MGDIAISIKNVSKKYEIGKQKDGSLRGTLTSLFSKKEKKSEDFWALKDVSFDIHKGDVVGIIGRNGAGKSTLLKVLSKITRPTEGRIEINGRIASLLEVGTGFHPELTGRENIFLNGTILGMTRKEVEAKFDEIVDFSGIEKFIDTPVKHYSSGMYVRLAFAVAAHLEPEILIIDEVLAVGDAEFQKKCLGKMKDVAGEGRTVIFVSHDLGAVKQLCNKGVLLNKGEVQNTGDIDEIISEYNSLGEKLENTICLKDYSKRFRGNKFATFISASINKVYFHPNDDLLINLEFQLNEESYYGKNVDIAIFIFDELNSCIYHLNSVAYNFILNLDYNNKVEFKINKVYLTKGVYKVGIHLSSNLMEFDYVDNALYFEVNSDGIYENKSKFVGKVYKKFEVKII